MYTLGALIAMFALVGGGWLIWYGWRDRRDPLRPKTSHRKWQVSRKTKLSLAAGLAVGVLAWILSGWFLMVPAAGAAAVLVPKMFARRGAEVAIDRLEALEDWLRHLVGLLNAGIGLEQAIIATRKTLPRELAPELRLLISRISTNSQTKAALMELADAMDDATGDLVCSALMISADLRASGLPRALKDFANTVAEDVKDRRAVEVDRRGPRTQAHMVSAIFIGVLLYLFIGTNYMDPYREPGMQVVLVALLGVFAGLLVYISHLTRPIPSPRFLREPEPKAKWWVPATAAADVPQTQPLASALSSNGTRTSATEFGGGSR